MGSRKKKKKDLVRSGAACEARDINQRAVDCEWLPFFPESVAIFIVVFAVRRGEGQLTAELTDVVNRTAVHSLQPNSFVRKHVCLSVIPTFSVHH